GVRPDVAVGLCVERSLEMIVALLGILKAGGAYVPLDPAYPAERLRFLLEDARVAVLLSQRGLRDRVPETDALRVELDGEGAGALVVMPRGLISPERIAEVIQNSQVNTLWLAAGLFNQVVEAVLPALVDVQQLLAGGDVLSVHHVKRVLHEHPECRVINGYGPTE